MGLKKVRLSLYLSKQGDGLFQQAQPFLDLSCRNIKGGPIFLQEL